MYYKGYKIRIYPTKAQKEIIIDHINACRYIWNYMLEQQKERYKNHEQYLSRFDMMNLIKPLKQQDGFEWLKSISHASMQQVCTNLDKGYRKFFDKTVPRSPKYKSKKRSKKTYPVRSDKGKFWFEEGYVHIELLRKVKFKSDFDIPKGREVKFSDVYITIENNKYMLSFGLECENQAHDLNSYKMGIDLGVKNTATVAYGSEKLVFGNINKSKTVRSYRVKEKYYQRRISHKYKKSIERTGSYTKTNNIIKLEQRLAYVRRRIRNIRKNYVYHIVKELIALYPSQIVMETLNTRDMMRNKMLACKIHEQAFSEFIDIMKYKCEWNGISFVQADRYFPSSKTCSSCGAVKKNLKLSDRMFVCSCCGFNTDRDYNAALNLMKYKA